jgi:hypothetical protein
MISSGELMNLAPHASDSEGLARRTLDAALTFSGGLAAALFQREHDGMLLFASVGVEQGGLEAVDAAWTSQRERLLSGEPVLTADAEASRAIVPVAEGAELVGLLYVEGAQPFQPQQAPVLLQLARIASMAFVMAPPAPAGDLQPEPVESYLARTPPEDVGRQQLVTLLAHNEWNIAKVARVLEVTRATVYNRLARFGIQRQRTLRPAGAPQGRPS